MPTIDPSSYGKKPKKVVNKYKGYSLDDLLDERNECKKYERDFSEIDSELQRRFG